MSLPTPEALAPVLKEPLEELMLAMSALTTLSLNELVTLYQQWESLIGKYSVRIEKGVRELTADDIELLGSTVMYELASPQSVRITAGAITVDQNLLKKALNNTLAQMRAQQ